MFNINLTSGVTVIASNNNTGILQVIQEDVLNSTTLSFPAQSADSILDITYGKQLTT